MDFRHEWKHVINVSDMIAVRQRMQAVTNPDPHAAGGSYKIRSLYFDTPTDRALREKIDSVNCREKFRIRCYNNDTSIIRLEKKSKQNGLSNKQKAALTVEEVKSIELGQVDWMLEREEPLLHELYAKMKSQGLRPKTIVDYVREPFVYGPGNVRVTLDHDIRTGLFSTNFLDPNCATVPIPQDPIILEVKWDEFLPDVIRVAVGLENRRMSAFSKYAISRVYD